MDLPFIKQALFQSYMRKCLAGLSRMNLNLKKNSVSKNMFIIILILVVLILINFWLIVIAVVAFAIGRITHKQKRSYEEE
jgi:type IV secretory pathway VirB3-like protein